MSDLDQEKLIATRRLNRLDDNLYIDSNDTNVGSIEEDIKTLEELIKNEHGELLNCWDYGEEAKKALENLIKGYRELDNEHENLLIDVYALFIPKSKIKEKIEEINSELEEKYSAEKISVFSGNTYMEKFKLLGKLQALQELMEDK